MLLLKRSARRTGASEPIHSDIATLYLRLNRVTGTVSKSIDGVQDEPSPFDVVDWLKSESLSQFDLRVIRRRCLEGAMTPTTGGFKRGAMLLDCLRRVSIQACPRFNEYATASLSVVKRIGNLTNLKSRPDPTHQLILACGAQPFLAVSKLGKAIMI